MRRPSLLVVYLAIGSSAVFAVAGCGGDAQSGETGAAGATGTGGGSTGTGGGGATGVAGTTGSAGATGAGGGASVPLSGLHVDGNAIKNGAGQVVRLHGVNRSGTEYRCIAANTTQTPNIFDGASDDASLGVIASWNVNAVRVPMNEDCWLAINGVPAVNAGTNYKNAIKAYVALLEARNMAPILELHWSAPGTTMASRQQPMPDADHSLAFWTDVAMTFGGDSRVIFELFNEPFPDMNRDSTAGWTCWRDGCSNATLLNASGMSSGTYTAVGMQALVTGVRGAGAGNIILLGGLQYSNTLTNWATYKPTDSMNNLAPAWHIYNFNGCAATTCFNMAPATLAGSYPIVATEFGENDCKAGTFLTSVLSFLDSKNASYLAWTWDAWGTCQAGTATGGSPATGSPWALMMSYTNGTPNSAYATAVHDHFAGL